MPNLRLRSERRRQGVTLVALSKRTGIDPANLSRLERGQAPAYPGWRRRIAEALEVADADWLFIEEGDLSEWKVTV